MTNSAVRSLWSRTFIKTSLYPSSSLYTPRTSCFHTFNAIFNAKRSSIDFNINKNLSKEDFANADQIPMILERERKQQIYFDRQLEELRQDYPEQKGFMIKIPENPGGKFKYSRRPVVIANAIDIPEQIPDVSKRSIITTAALAKVNAEERGQLYAFAELNGRIYDIQAGDLIVTDHIPEVKLGDVLRLDRISEIGGREYAIKGNPYVHPEYHQVRAVVVSVTKSKPIVTLRHGRKYRNKRIETQMTNTLLRVFEIKLKTN